MDKKQYKKPTMRVVELQHRSQLLTGSTPDPYGGPFGYAPDLGTDENKNGVIKKTRNRWVRLTKCQTL